MLTKLVGFDAVNLCMTISSNHAGGKGGGGLTWGDWLEGARSAAKVRTLGLTCAGPNPASDVTPVIR